MNSRKIEMMKMTYRYAAVMFLAYMAVCGYTDTAPDGIAIAALFGAIGVGQGSANWANAKEHESGNKKGA